MTSRPFWEYYCKAPVCVEAAKKRLEELKAEPHRWAIQIVEFSFDDNIKTIIAGL